MEEDYYIDLEEQDTYKDGKDFYTDLYNEVKDQYDNINETNFLKKSISVFNGQYHCFSGGTLFCRLLRENFQCSSKLRITKNEEVTEVLYIFKHEEVEKTIAFCVEKINSFIRK